MAKGNSRSFAAGLEAYAKKTRRTLDETHRAVVVELFSSVVMDTPADIGTLRANWNISTDSPDRSTNPEAADKTGEATVQKIQNHSMKIGDRTFLTNAMPYAEVAEYGLWSGPTEKVLATGYSRKSPSGMVRRNMARVGAILRRAVTSARSKK